MTNSSSTDTVVSLGREIAELEARHDELERLESEARANDDPSAETYYETACQDVLSRINALRSALSCFEAQSLEGALIHLGLAFILVDSLDAASEGTRQEVRRTLERTIASARRAIERSAGITLDAMGLAAYSNGHLDPWVRVEDRIAKVRSMTEGRPEAA